MVELTDALQGGIEFGVVAQPLLDQSFLFGGETDLFGAAAGVADGQDPDGMAATVGANGATGAMADLAVEQRAAEDLGGGGEGGGKFGAGVGDPCVFHSSK